MRLATGKTEGRSGKAGSGAFGPAESNEIKKAIADAIVDTIRRRNLSRRDAAATIGVGQDKVSLVFRGRVRGFSIERLLKFLMRLGHDIEIRASDTTGSGPGHAQFSVTPLPRPDETGA